MITGHCRRPKMEKELASVVRQVLCGTRGTNGSVASDKVVHNPRRIEWSYPDSGVDWARRFGIW